MAIHHPTPPLGGGERPRLPSAQVGPVTQAVLVMRSAELRERLEARTGRKPADPHIPLTGSPDRRTRSRDGGRSVFEVENPDALPYKAALTVDNSCGVWSRGPDLAGAFPIAGPRCVGLAAGLRGRGRPVHRCLENEDKLAVPARADPRR